MFTLIMLQAMLPNTDHMQCNADAYKFPLYDDAYNVPCNANAD
jgi:hypothetical protein